MSPTVIPTTIDALVAGILDRMKDKIEHYAIEPFPDGVETYKLTHQRGAFLVAYRGADYAAVEDIGDVAQTRTMLVDVAVACRQLMSESGATTMLELARTVLAGHQVPGFQKLVPFRERFLSRTDAVWMYAITFRTTTVAVEIDDDETLGPALARLTMGSPFNTSEISSNG